MCLRRLRRCGRSSPHGSSPPLPESPTISASQKNWPRTPLVTALELWPDEGIPENPGAWLMTAAKRRAIDSLRRGRMLVQKHEEIARELEWQQQWLGDALEH